MENDDVGSSHSSPLEDTLEQRYNRLQKEFSKVRSQLTVLKNVVIEERKTVTDLKTQLRLKDQMIRRHEQETESLRFCNGQIQSRLVVLQKDLADRTSKSKNSKKKELESVNDGPSSSAEVLHADFVQLVEINAHLSTQLNSVQTEYQHSISSLETKLKSAVEGEDVAKKELNDYKAMYENLERRMKLESEVSSKKDLADLRAQVSELQKENNHLKVELDDARVFSDNLRKKMADTDHQAEIMKKLTQQIDSQKDQLLLLQQDREKYMLEAQILKLKVEHSRDAVDSSGDDLCRMGEPTLLRDMSSQDHLLNSAYNQLRNRVHSLVCELQYANGKAFHYQAECSALQLRLQLAEKTIVETEKRLVDAQHHIDDLKKQMETTVLQTNDQMSLMSEHLASMNEKLQVKTDEINLLKYQLQVQQEGKLKGSKSGIR